MTPEWVEVCFYDDRMAEIPFDEPTDIVAISVETFTALRAYKIARQFRARRAGGDGGISRHAVARRSGSGSGRDILGDAEPVWLQVLADAKARCSSPHIAARDAAPSAGCAIAGRFTPSIPIRISRSLSLRGAAISNAIFARSPRSTKRAKITAPCEVVKEMAATRSDRFFIVDDNVVSQPVKVRELCREMIPLRTNWVGQASIHIANDDSLLELMAKSGCRGVLIGMESLDPANLRDMDKSWNIAQADYKESLSRFRKHGLAVYGTFLFGYDNDDAAIVQRSIDFAQEQKLFLAAFNHLVPFPGTPLYRRLETEGRLLKPKWWLDPESRVGDVVFRPKKVSPRELEALPRRTPTILQLVVHVRSTL